MAQKMLFTTVSIPSDQTGLKIAGRFSHMPKAASDQEIVLKMYGVGVLLTLYGLRQNPDHWKFLLERDESTMQDFLFDKNAEVGNSLYVRSKYADSWSEALDLLDKYPWTIFVPAEVHPKFRHLVWSAIQERDARQDIKYGRPVLREWKRLCSEDALPNSNDQLSSFCIR
jgi:hypothetical protein